MTIEEMNVKKKELGYTYEQIAARSNLPVGTVQKVLGGITKAPRYETLRALERAFLPTPVQNTGGSYLDVLRSAEGKVCEPAHTYGERKLYGPDERKLGPYTVEDYFALPDEPRVELIDGEFYDMAAPNGRHQAIAGEIYRQLANYVRSNKGLCLPMISPLDVQLDCDDKTMVQPDVMILCDRSKYQNGRVFGAPDFVAEVLSPSTGRKDKFKKLEKYSTAGVREYWLVDPMCKKVVVYDLEHDEHPAIYGFDQCVPLQIYEGKCQVDFAELYEYVSFFYTDDAR